MPDQELHGTAAGGSPHPVRSWRALLALLAVVPATLYLAAPLPAHAGGDHAPEQGLHEHSPADMPFCRHDPRHGSALTLPGGQRNADSPAPDDSLVALPVRRPGSSLVSATGTAPSGRPPGESLQPLPVYLLTQRLRI